MSTIPCIGFGITVLYSLRTATTAVFERGRGGFMKARNMQRRFHDKPKLLRAYVTAIVSSVRNTERVLDPVVRDTRIEWKSGATTGSVWLSEEFDTWTRGHGPEARQAFLAARALESR